MTLNYFIHLLLSRWRWLVTLPLIVAAAVLYIYMQKPKEFFSRMTLYTGLSSGVSIQAEANKADNSAIAYENLINILKSDKTIENVSLTLLANALIHGASNDEYITKESYDKLYRQIPKEVKIMVDRNSVEQTIVNFRNYLKKNNKNFLYDLIYKSSSNLSKSSLSRIDAKRVRSSDILEISYTADDPALCFQTLNLFYEETVRNYKSVRVAQSNDVVDYFKAQIDSTSRKLALQEDDYVRYNQENKIINFSEQTKHVVTQRLGMDNRFDDLMMQREGASMTIKEMEMKMGLQNRLQLKSAQVLYLRGQIANLAASNALQLALSADSLNANVTNRSYDVKLQGLKNEFNQVLDSISLINNTASGISMESILSKWLDNVVDYEVANAQLPILENRAKVLDGLYDIFAPIGATVKRKERSIDVTEKQYLSLLGSLSSAKMREQNDELMANAIRMLDEPFYPYTALPDKSKIMAALSGFGMLILIISLVFITEYFDRTLLNPVKAERILGLKAKFLYPQFGKHGVNDENVGKRVRELFVLELLRNLDLSSTHSINLLSIQEKEGKSLVASVIREQLDRIASGSEELSNIKNIQIREIPALENNYTAPGSLNHNALNILVCRSTKAWRSRDLMLLRQLISQLGHSPLVLLNGVSIDVFESVMGELPLNRSLLHRFVKRMFNFEFNSRDSF